MFNHTLQSIISESFLNLPKSFSTMERWPNLFIVGAPKAGTTSLHEYLKNIPEIFMSSVKEPYYFCKKMVPEYHYTIPIRDKKKYLDLFSKVKDEKYVGESSVWYLSDPDSVNLIHQVSPNARIIICLRDPVDRAFSHYLMNASRRLYKTSSFHEQVRKEIDEEIDFSIPNIRFKAGLYFDDVKKYFDIFGRTNVKIIIFEEFIQNTKKTVQDILRFLGLKEEIDNFEEEVHNPFSLPHFPVIYNFLNIQIIRKIRRRFISETFQKKVRKIIFSKKVPKPIMLDEDRILLKNFYQDDIQKLCELLGRQLPWSNFKKEKHTE